MLNGRRRLWNPDSIMSRSFCLLGLGCLYSAPEETSEECFHGSCLIPSTQVTGCFHPWGLHWATPTSLCGCCFQSWLLHLPSSFLGKQWKMLGFLLHMWETQMGLLALDISCAEPWPLRPFAGRTSGWKTLWLSFKYTYIYFSFHPFHGWPVT